MLKRLFMFCLSIVCVLTPLLAQSDWLEWNEDIAAPEELAGWQEKYEELSEIAEHPLISIPLLRKNWSNYHFIRPDDREYLVLYLQIRTNAYQK